MKSMLKRSLIAISSLLVLSATVLAIHIYIVTRPQMPDARTRGMARIDFKQEITETDALKIKTWLYQQKGIDHVLCNVLGKTVVFTFSPLQADADKIADQMRTSLHYNVVRFKPSDADMKKGCPVSQKSMSYMALSFFKKYFLTTK